jgi:signal peptidase I
MSAAGRRLITAASTLLLLAGLLAVAFPAAGIATGRWRLLPILSGSMSPRLPTGSLALAVPASQRSIRVGDVIVFNIPIGDHHQTAHRVVRVVEGGSKPVLVTKGDANKTADPWRLKLSGNSVWTVRTQIPLVGYAVTFVRRWVLLLLGGGVLALLACCLRLVWRLPPATSARTPAVHAASRH